MIFLKGYESRDKMILSKKSPQKNGFFYQKNKKMASKTNYSGCHFYKNSLVCNYVCFKDKTYLFDNQMFTQ